MLITGYEAICNIGNNIKAIYNNAIKGNNNCFCQCQKFFEEEDLRIGMINTNLPSIKHVDFKIRANQITARLLDYLFPKINELKEKYQPDRIALICATTNSGVDEFEKSTNIAHCELSNPLYYLKKRLSLEKSYLVSVSTACSSGIKAFSLARDILYSDIADCAIILCVDSKANVPIFGFHSLGVLSSEPSLPFSRNRKGLNIGEGGAMFLIEKNNNQEGIEILGIGESTDITHFTTPDSKANSVVEAINLALDDANINPQDIDYINLHGTGTIANDLMEAHAINQIFSDTIPTSSTKPLTGHCLGASAGIEIALCARLLEKFNGKFYPHIYDNQYDEKIDKIKLVNVNDTYSKCERIMCNSFGFGGSNAIIILGKNQNGFS